MNAEKAREYFSSYKEGTLEGGIRQSFEQKIRSDRQLLAEYEAFSYAMDQLDTLKDEEIPVPFYLNARIQARLEDARKPAKPSRGLVFYLPRFGLAAAAAAAILFAAKGIMFPTHGSTIVASAFGTGGDSGVEPSPTWPSESIGVEPAGTTAHIHYSSASDRTVQIYDGTGKKLKFYSLKEGEPLKADLENSNPTAAVFEVRVSDSGPDEFIAVPGSTRTESPAANTADAPSQSGTVIDFVKALANRYGKPVVYSGKDVAAPLSWNLTQATDKAEADQDLKGTNLEESVTLTNVLSISDR